MGRGWMTPRALLVVVSIGLIVAGLARMVEIRTPDRPEGSWQQLDTLADRDDLNLVFILIDTLRADRLSAYGYGRPTSPNFDALAESGIRFRDVLAQSSWTKTSMASLWTATYPSTNDVTRYPHGLPETATLPAEILRDAGFRTVGIWRNGWVAPNFGFDQGFDLYYKPESNRRHAAPDNPSAFRLPGTDEDITAAAVEFLRHARSDRFFLYLHYMDLHQYVYDDSADFGTTYSDIYDNSIHWVDKVVGTFVAHLQRMGLMKNTVVVISSDHGEAFGEHGTEGHARDVYWETTKVPLLITLPFRLEEGIEVETPVENVDIWPTLMDLLGLPPLPAAEGRSVVPLIRAAAQGEESVDHGRPRFAELDQTWGLRDARPDPLFSIAKGRYRLFHQAENPDQVELYDLADDPREQENIADREPRHADLLMGRLETYVEAPAPEWGSPEEVALDDFELDQLRALGYAIGGRSAEEMEEAEEGESSSGSEGE